MLRVTSILYLQKVWSNCSATVEAEAIAKPITPIVYPHDEEEEEQHPEITNKQVIMQEPEQEEEEQEEEEEQQHLEADSNINQQDQVSIKASQTESLKDESICSSLVIPSPSVVANMPEAVVVIIQPPPKVVEREYYEDDIDLDDDEKDEDEEEEEEEINTPPSTPSSKFSPKRMLHRAKSSINDESVRSLGRRTSMFLEKFNHQPSLPVTPNLKRQSSKLTNKGKTLSRKIKRVLSFHHTK